MDFRSFRSRAKKQQLTAHTNKDTHTTTLEAIILVLVGLFPWVVVVVVGIVSLVKVVRGSDLPRKHLDIWCFAACQSWVDLCKTLMGVKNLTLGGGLSGGFQGLKAQETDWTGPGLAEKDSPYVGTALPRLQESVHDLEVWAPLPTSFFGAGARGHTPVA